ncbi:MAG: hypothetical protein ABI593_03645 [Betaproteobacteria bacterium]
MARRPRKSSACVTLVLIGAAALSGCGDSTTSSRRASYATKEECLADWGDPRECEQQEARRSDGSRSHTFFGPSIGRSSGGGSRSSTSSRSSSSSGGHSVARGGFGSHGSSAS